MAVDEDQGHWQKRRVCNAAETAQRRVPLASLCLRHARAWPEHPEPWPECFTLRAWILGSSPRMTGGDVAD